MEFSKRMKNMLPQIAVARPANNASGMRLRVFILPELQTW